MAVIRFAAILHPLVCASALHQISRHVRSSSLPVANKVRLSGGNDVARAAAVTRSMTSAQAALVVFTGFPLMAAAEAPVWVAPVSTFLTPFLFVVQFMFLCRILLSWYPEINLNKLPFNLVAWPTEPILRLTRGIVPPAFGVDISPVIWIALVNLAQELLLGQQGVLVLIAKS